MLCVTDGVGVPNAEFFGRYAAMVGTELAQVSMDELRQRLDDSGVGADIADYFRRQGTYSNAKARHLLGWEPAVDLDEGMRRTEAWLREAGLLG